MYVVLTQAWNLLGGYGGYLNFGMVTFFGIGAYTTAILHHYYGLSAFLTAPVAGIAAAIAGLLIGIPTLRLRGAYFALVTMIITFAVQILALDLRRSPRARSASTCRRLPLTPLGVERLFYFLFLGFAVLVTALVYAIQHSNIGWALVAIREDEDAAEIVGVRTVEVKWAANALACFIAGVVGGLYAQRIAYVEPIGTFSFDTSLNVVLMAVIGGPGTWQGPLIGSAAGAAGRGRAARDVHVRGQPRDLQSRGDPDRAVHPGRRDGRAATLAQAAPASHHHARVA